MELFSAIGAYVHGDEKTYDGLPLPAGVHLRWAYVTDLGFPPQGVRIQRMDVAFTDEFNRLSWTGNWQDITSVRPCPTADFARNIVHRVGGFGFCRREYIELPELTEELRRLEAAGPAAIDDWTDDPAGRALRLRRFDLILLALLDPQLARVGGMAWIDLGIAPVQPVAYRLSGTWPTVLGSRRYSVESYPPVLGPGVARVGPIQIAVDGWITPHLSQLEQRPSLSAKTAILALSSPESIGELKIELIEGTAQALVASALFEADGRTPVQARAEGNALVLRSPEMRDVAIRSREGHYFPHFAISAIETRLAASPPGPQSVVLVRDLGLNIDSSAGDPSSGVPPARIHRITEFDITALDLRLDGASVVEMPPMLDGLGALPRSRFGVELRSTPRAGAPRPTLAHLSRRPGLGAVASTPAPGIPTWPGPSAALAPRLIAEWPFAANTTDSIGGNALVTGPNDLISVTPTAAQSPNALRISAAAAIHLQNPRALLAMRRSFQIEAWVGSLDPAGPTSTLIATDRGRELWLGLLWEAGVARPAIRIAGHTFKSSNTFRPRRLPSWNHLIFSWDGRSIGFCVDGGAERQRHPFSTEITQAAFNAVHVGCVPLQNGDSQPMQGWISNLRVWVFEPVQIEAGSRDLWFGAQLAPSTGVTFHGTAHVIAGEIYGKSMRVVELDGGGAIQISRGATSSGPDGAWTIEGWVRPEGAGGEMIVAKFGNGVTLGVDVERRLFLQFDAIRKTSRLIVPAGLWTRLAVSFTEGRLRFEIDDREDEDISLTAEVANIRRLEEPIWVGAGRFKEGVGAERPWHGKIGDLRVWTRARGTPALARVPAGVTEQDRILWRDFDVPSGVWSYSAAGVDIFGRLGRNTAPVAATIPAQPPPAAPQNCRAEWQPLRARVTQAEAHGEGGWRITTDLAAGQTLRAALGGGAPGSVLRRIAGQAAEVRKVAAGTSAEERWRIASGRELGGFLQIDLEPNTTELIQPRAGDEIRIDVDVRLRLSWVWSGRQRVFNPEVVAFWPLLFLGEPGLKTGVVTGTRPLSNALADEGRFIVQIRWSVPFVAAASEAVGAWFTVAGRRLIVRRNKSIAADHSELEVEDPNAEPSMPRVESTCLMRVRPEAIGLDLSEHGAWSIRLDQLSSIPIGALTLPQSAGVTSSNATVTLCDADELTRVREASRELGPEELWAVDLGVPIPDSLLRSRAVPGLLAGSQERSGEGSWRTWDVVWTANREDAGGLGRLYVRGASLPATGGVDLGGTRPSRLAELRYTAGALMQVDLDIPRLASGEPADQGLIGLVSVTRPSPGYVDGQNVSPTSPPVRFRQVDKSMPPAPPAPRVNVGPPDVFGLCRVSIAWDAPAEVRCEVWRTSEATAAAADVDLRRARLAFYAVDAVGETIRDDPDLEGWLRARFPAALQPFDGAVNRWVDFFAGAERLARMSRERRELVSEAWRAWSARYHGSLASAEWSALLRRRGMERAFARITHAPVAASASGMGEYMDTVEASTRGFLGYRLQSFGAAGNQGAGFGPTSALVSTPTGALPAAVTLRQLVAGRAAVDLDWTLSPDPDVRAYRVFRATDAGAIEDLRWAGEDGLVIAGEISDPLLRAEGRRLRLPEGVDATDVAGVYARDDGFRTVDRPRTLDLFDRTGAAPPGILPLRRVPEGAPLILAVRAADGSLTAIDRRPGVVPWRDRGLPAVDVWYRVAAINRQGARGQASPAMRARPQLPDWFEAPEVEITRSADNDAQDRVQITLRSPSLSDRVFWILRRLDDEPEWTPLFVLDRVGVALNDAVPRGSPASYRVRIRTVAGHRWEDKQEFQTHPSGTH